MSFRDMPEGSLSREISQFYDARGFPFPDSWVVHHRFSRSTTGCVVLAHYGSTVESEVEGRRQVGPNRSMRTCVASMPASMMTALAASVKGVDPQMKTVVS